MGDHPTSGFASGDQARARAMQRCREEAEALDRGVLMTTPDTPEALNYVGLCSLARGELASALRYLTRAVHVQPGAAQGWVNLGVVYLAAHSCSDALHAFDHALALNPLHAEARLYRGAALERLRQPGAAAVAYAGALAVAQRSGMWLDAATTTPNMRPHVVHANAFVKRYRRHVLLASLGSLRGRAGGDALRRIKLALDIYLALRTADYPDPRQYCQFFYVPGLTTQPYYAQRLFPWHAALESHVETIREELSAVLAHPDGVVPFLGTNDNKLLGARGWLAGTRGDGQWNSFFFYRHGKAFRENAQRCPRTAAILESLPLVRIGGHAPEVLFSILTPGTHILPHHGVTNTRLITHLPLIVPGHCALRVGGVEHVWREGRCVTFDDTFEHEAWNHSEAVRVVMIFDAWHPDLAEAEREAITTLVAKIGDFDAAARIDAADTP